MAVATTQAFRRHLPATAFRVTLLARVTFGRMDTTIMDPAVITGVQADGFARRARVPNGFPVNGIAITADTGCAEATGDSRVVKVSRGSGESCQFYAV